MTYHVPTGNSQGKTMVTADFGGHLLVLKWYHKFPLKWVTINIHRWPIMLLIITTYKRWWETECELLEGISFLTPRPCSVHLHHLCSLTISWTPWHSRWSSSMSSSFLLLGYYISYFFFLEDSFLTPSEEGYFSWFRSHLKCCLSREAFPWSINFESLPQPLSSTLNATWNYLLVLCILAAPILLRIRAGTL